MSHMSYRGCKHCKLPEYACDCDEQDLDEQSPVQKILKGIEPWEEDYFFGSSGNRVGDFGAGYCGKLCIS